MATEKRTNPAEEGRAIPQWLEAVRAQVESLRFGQVQVVVHDSRVVQIEKIEKIRFEPKPSPSAV